MRSRSAPLFFLRPSVSVNVVVTKRYRYIGNRRYLNTLPIYEKKVRFGKSHGLINYAAQPGPFTRLNYRSTTSLGKKKISIASCLLCSQVLFSFFAQLVSK
jgi:hypothetical protein